MQKAIIGV